MRRYREPRPVGRPPIPIEKVIAIQCMRTQHNMSYRKIAHNVGVSHETCRRYCLEADDENNE